MKGILIFKGNAENGMAVGGFALIPDEQHFQDWQHSVDNNTCDMVKLNGTDKEIKIQNQSITMKELTDTEYEIFEKTIGTNHGSLPVAFCDSGDSVIRLWETEEFKGTSRIERLANGIQHIADKCKELGIFKVTCSPSLALLCERLNQPIFTWETDVMATEDYVQIGETKLSFEPFKPDHANDKLRAEFFEAHSEQLVKQAVEDMVNKVPLDDRSGKLNKSFEEWKKSKLF